MEEHRWLSLNNRHSGSEQTTHCVPTTVIKRTPVTEWNRHVVPFRTQGSDSDEFSDHDSHYSEDFADEPQESANFEESEDTQCLLSFLKNVDSDIQKFFGKKNDKGDSCEIYEDKWISTKSGRELYYDELLKIAKGDNGEIVGKNSANQNGGRTTYSGTMDPKKGLGPFSELFEYGLYSFYGDQQLNKSAKRMVLKRANSLVPMSGRKFPISFWREPQPGCRGNAREKVKPITASLNMLHPTYPPDFSDLLQSWTGEVLNTGNHSSGDCSSDTSLISSESSV